MGLLAAGFRCGDSRRAAVLTLPAGFRPAPAGSGPAPAGSGPGGSWGGPSLSGGIGLDTQLLGHTSLLVSCGGVRLLTDPLPVPVRPAPDYVVVSHGHGDRVRGLRLYPGVPRIGSRAVAFRPGDVAVAPWQSLTSGRCGWSCFRPRVTRTSCRGFPGTTSCFRSLRRGRASGAAARAWATSLTTVGPGSGGRGHALGPGFRGVRGRPVPPGCGVCPRPAMGPGLVQPAGPGAQAGRARGDGAGGGANSTPVSWTNPDMRC